MKCCPSSDYYRYHFPISGTVLEAKIFTLSPLFGGIDNWDTKTNSYILKSNSLSWQVFETRRVVILETLIGLVALLPIEMGQVSSFKEIFGEIKELINKEKELTYLTSLYTFINEPL